MHILSLGMFINRAGAFLIMFLTLYLQDELELGTTFATRAMGVFGAGSVTGTLVGGQLADRIGRKPVLLLALCGAASVLFVFPYLRTRWSILTGVFLLAAVADMYRPAVHAMIADMTEGEERSLAFGLNFLAINLGFAVAGPLGGELADISFPMLFGVDAATALVFAGIIAWKIPETLPAKLADHADGDDSKVPLGVAVERIVRDRVFMLLCLATLFLSLCYMQMNSTLPLYIKGLGYEKNIVGRIIGVNGLLIVLFQIPVTQVVTRYHRGWMITLAAALVGFGFALTSLATVHVAIVGTICVWTLGEMMHAPLISATVGDLAPASMRARYMGAFTMSWSVANMIGAPLGGEVLENHGAERLWVLAGLVGLLASIGFWTIRRQMAVKKADRRAASGSPGDQDLI